VSWKDDIGEALLPWGLTPSGLNDGEGAELARRQKLPAELSKPREKPMAKFDILKKGANKVVDLVKGNPKLQAAAEQYIATATGKQVDLSNGTAVAALVNRGPAPAAVVLRAAVKAGVNPDHIFEDIILGEQIDSATQAIIGSLREAYAFVRAGLDKQATIHSSGGLAQALLNKEILEFARRQFGSSQAIREAHAKLRAFISMDTQVLEETLALHS